VTTYNGSKTGSETHKISAPLICLLSIACFGLLGACSESTGAKEEAALSSDGITFLAFDPASPSNSSLTPFLTGTLAASDASISLYSDSICSNLLASGTKVEFESSGIAITVQANSDTSIFARAFNENNESSECTALATYTHDNISPDDPSFGSTSPSSPNNSSTSPSVIGLASSDTATVNLFSNDDCSDLVASDSKDSFEDSGITYSSATLNGITEIYAQAVDLAGNNSSCIRLTIYTHDSEAPTNPSFVSLDPASPSNSVTNPKVIGTAASDSASVKLYSADNCSVGSQISSVDETREQFEGEGITVTASANSVITIYGQSADDLGNLSDCTTLTTYRHDPIAPTAVSNLSHAATSLSLENSPEVTWSASTETGSGIAFYEYSVGATALDTSIKGWTSNGTSTSVTISGLSLQYNETYFVNVRARDVAGNISNIVSSSGWRVPRIMITANAVDYVLNGGLTILNTDTVNLSANEGSGITCTWSTGAWGTLYFSDPNSCDTSFYAGESVYQETTLILTTSDGQSLSIYFNVYPPL
jgi:hypothetical protein